MSTVTPDHLPRPRPRVPGVTLDDTGRIASDLPCWSCDYNLRTLATDVACPECGMPIATTLEHRAGRKARPFSLHTLNPVSQIVGLLFGMFGPGMVVLLASFDPMQPLTVDWQSGQLRDYVGTMLAGRAMWAFYPFLLWSYIALVVLLSAPMAMGRLWWVRIGLWLGCLLGVQYQIILSVGLLGLSEQFWIACVFGLIPMGILAAVVISQRALDATRKPKPRQRRNWQVSLVVVGLTIAALIGIGVASRGMVLMVVLLGGPYLMLLCMSAALCRVYRTDFSQPAERSKPIPVAATALGYVAAWPIAISQAQIVYNSLPTTDPSCYACTASAHGHRWLTRATPVRFPGGRVVLVTQQMRTLKAAELLIAARFPRLHRSMRRVYDRVGPRIASQIRSRWLADVSYLFFVPFAAIAWLALPILGRARDIDRAYQVSS
ncbi:MAG: hypothetical protein KTR15_00850 [Phycisphaeraceae bacterium]|nr:hypothetical protein [Phycisphaeraceae bacterium]